MLINYFWDWECKKNKIKRKEKKLIVSLDISICKQIKSIDQSLIINW